MTVWIVHSVVCKSFADGLSEGKCLLPPAACNGSVEDKNECFTQYTPEAGEQRNYSLVLMHSFRRGFCNGTFWVCSVFMIVSDVMIDMFSSFHQDISESIKLQQSQVCLNTLCYFTTNEQSFTLFLCAGVPFQLNPNVQYSAGLTLVWRPRYTSS